MTSLRVGVDIGGTFTDIVFLAPSGVRTTRKVPSTVDDYARAITEGVAAILAEQGADGRDIVELLHGTTVASNAIPELKGARTGLITTKGFRDVLEIRTLPMPRLYDLARTNPPPLVERHLRVEVDERLNAAGEVERAIVERYLTALTGELQRIGIAAPVLLMQSNGGLTTARSAAELPMNIIESGPAADVVGVQALARQIGLDRAFSFDRGGTTDANVVLGDLNPEYLAGGSVRLEAARARDAIVDRIARPLGLAVEALFAGLVHEARARLGEDGFAASRIEILRSVSLHCYGQSFELTLPVAGALDLAALVTVRVIGRGLPEQPRLFRDRRGLVRYDGVRPRRRSGGSVRGRGIRLHDSDPPGGSAKLDRFGNIIISIPTEAA